jgi:putative DNA primase/helicase
VGALQSEGSVNQRQEFLTAADIHARVSWPTVLEALGIDGALLAIKDGKRAKNAPCPACGGRDRFFFDNKHGRGDFFCNGCGPGDGFELLSRVHGWSFKETRQRVIEAAGLAEDDDSHEKAVMRPRPPTESAPVVSVPSARVHALRRDRCAVENCGDAVEYLASRHLWPLPAGCQLRAHPTVEYWHELRRIGRYPALVADVLDVSGELVTAHVTWLSGGKKLEGYEPRKTLGRKIGRRGCAVRLLPATDFLGIAEGIETALSAALIDGVPVWAAINAGGLSSFEPPPGVTRLRVYADRDDAGLVAALELAERLQGRIRLEVRIPKKPAKDWNDVLVSRNSRGVVNHA